MATDTLEKAVVETGRPADMVAADMAIVKRHLRRKMRVDWTDELDGVQYGIVRIGDVEWNVDLCYREKYDVYRFRFYIPQEYSPQLARRFDVQAANPYAMVNDTLAVLSTLRMMTTLDLNVD